MFDRSTHDPEENQKLTHSVKSFRQKPNGSSQKLVDATLAAQSRQDLKVNPWRKFTIHHISKSKKFSSENQVDGWPKMSTRSFTFNNLFSIFGFRVVPATNVLHLPEKCFN